MNKTKKRWLLAALILVVAGGVVFAGSSAALGFEYGALSTARCETVTHEIRERFDRIDVSTAVGDVILAPAEDSVCRVVCHEMPEKPHTVAVEDGTLTVRSAESGAWFGLFLDRVSVTVYLPQSEYAALSVHADTGDVEIPGGFRFGSVELTGSTADIRCAASAEGTMRIRTATGSVRLSDLSAGALTVSVGTGESTLSGVRCRSLRAEATTGDLNLRDVVAEGELNAHTTTGDIRLDRCDAASLAIAATTGDISGTLCSGKQFTARSSTGDVSLPASAAGGACDVETTTGDIHIEIA